MAEKTFYMARETKSMAEKTFCTPSETKSMAEKTFYTPSETKSMTEKTFYMGAEAKDLPGKLKGLRNMKVDMAVIAIVLLIIFLDKIYKEETL